MRTKKIKVFKRTTLTAHYCKFVKSKNSADFLNYRALHQLDMLWLGDCIFYLLNKGDWPNKVRELRKVARSSIL